MADQTTSDWAREDVAKNAESKQFQLLTLPGDGIGAEVMSAATQVLTTIGDRHGISFSFSSGLIGGAAWQAEGVALADSTLAAAKASDAILLGAVGGPQFADLPRAVRPEAGLLRLRKELELYANLRPICCMPAMASASSLRAELVADLDLLIVRELASGVYFGTPRGQFTDKAGERYAVDTQFYSASEITRIAKIGFELAAQRSNLLHSVEKANVMETGSFWREIVTDLGKQSFPRVQLQHMYADNCAMQLVRQPKQFDVIVTDNLFGDILSDCAAMLTGSLGMLPSASLGAMRNDGSRLALYEPVHGSAPDIVGTGKANPIAMILSAAMLLRYSCQLPDLALRVERAVQRVLAVGLATPDIATADSKPVSTEAMTEAIIAQL